MSGKRLNPQVLLEAACTALFGVLIIYFVRSGAYLAYVTPRMEGYLYFAAGVFFLWTAVGLRRIFRPRYKVRTVHCYVLAVPGLLLLLTPNPMQSTAPYTGALGQNALYGQNVPGKSSTKAAPEGLFAEEIITPEEFSAEQDVEPSSDPSVLEGLDVKGRTITVSDEDFAYFLTQIYGEPKRYEGYTVTLKGFVYKDMPEVPENGFLIARLMMACCIADLTPAGMLCRYDRAEELSQDAWFTVEGTLKTEKKTYDGVEYDDPVLLVTKVTPAQPVEGYIYPY